MGFDQFDLSPRSWRIPAIILLLSGLIALGGEEFRLLLRFDRIWISEGETWRLVSGHLSHLGWAHYALNGVGLVLVWFLVGPRFSAVGWWIVIATSLITIDAGLWFLNGTLVWYVGLSGLIHGVLGAGILVKLRQPDGETLLLAGLLIAKIIWEQFAGPVPGSVNSVGGPVVVDAHLYGLVGGIIGAILARVRVESAGSI